MSPEAFDLWAGDFLQAARDYQQPTRFSAVPYFLLCRAIELEIKSKLLVDAKQGQVKKYGHDLIKAYNALPAKHKALSPEQLAIVSEVNELYEVPHKKHFEYWNPESALTGRYANAPELASLDAIAAKLVNAPRN